MLEKKRKGFLTSDLITICLMKADFNFENKILVRDLMQCAERGVNSPKGKYNSSKGGNIYYELCQQTTGLQCDTL